MTDRNKLDTRKNEGDRGRDQDRDHARFGVDNDRDRYGAYGSDRYNDQDNSRRYNQDGNPSRQRFGSERDSDADNIPADGTDFDRSSSPFRSGNESTRQFQPTVSPFRGRSDGDRMARTSKGGGVHLGSQMSESIYGRDEPYQGNKFAGGFSGRGPKGYERSDDRIRDEVCDCLADDDNIDASEIEVQVTKGEVTLTGTVSERRVKRLAEDAVERIKGVKDVHNQIRVQSGMSSSVPVASFTDKDEPGKATEPASTQLSSKIRSDGHPARH